MLLFLLAVVACDNNGDNTAPSGPAPSTPATPAPSDTIRRAHGDGRRGSRAAQKSPKPNTF